MITRIKDALGDVRMIIAYRVRNKPVSCILVLPDIFGLMMEVRIAGGSFLFLLRWQ